jgi:hypothetical protein
MQFADRIVSFRKYAIIAGLARQASVSGGRPWLNLGAAFALKNLWPPGIVEHCGLFVDGFGRRVRC